MNNKVKQIVSLFLVLLAVSVMAKENVYKLGATLVVNTKVAAGCDPSSSQTDLDVNNIRTTILNGGDMWWNLTDARYEIPKGGNRHSMFAGALWIGGVDAGGQLKVAAMTYRQSGNDFWPGPLDEVTATISATECAAWDRHFKITREEVEFHVANYLNPNYTMPASIKNWPAYGNYNNPNVGFRHLAPFYDVNDDLIYDPEDGDYPDYNVTGTNDNASLFGDQTLWWVFNDKGNIHTETEAEPLGLEIHAQAFGFTADNEVNDMTFYNYKIINRSTTPLNDTYFGQWVDPDLGFYLDDYVGCDVGLGLGFCYNGDAEDEGAAGYGFNPPAIGVDFFQGPLADANDGIDNDRDGVIDEQGEQIIMSKFVYYNNDFTVIGNPENGTHIYNYLRGIWKDNVPMTFGGDGHGGGSTSTNDLCNFMFPGTSDDQFIGKEWTEQTASNIPADRRFLQSAGAFTLQPGAVNEITTGVVWARAKSGGQTASINLVKVYDREAQALFDNNFNILNGPDAPDLQIQELDKQLVFTLSNSGISNNINESYSEKDPYITSPINLLNSPNYEFQGYLVYQLANNTVSVTDLD
ncbi:MAG: T9SS type A sorting domain-containing protein, partial [Fidelibacterota bacterium]